MPSRPASMRLTLRHGVTVMLIAVGAIHLLAVPGVLGGERLTSLYGIVAEAPELSLLLRHRALLFGSLGSFMVWAAFRPALQAPALVAGSISVVSFLVLALLAGGVNPRIEHVVMADGVALACQLVAQAARWAQPAAAADPTRSP